MGNMASMPTGKKTATIESKTLSAEQLTRDEGIIEDYKDTTTEHTTNTSTAIENDAPFPAIPSDLTALGEVRGPLNDKEAARIAHDEAMRETTDLDQFADRIKAEDRIAIHREGR